MFSGLTSPGTYKKMGNLYVIPYLFSIDQTNQISIDIKNGCYFLTRCFQFKHQPYSSYFVFCQFCHTIFFSILISSTALFIHIKHVFRICSNPKMLWVKATGIITRMANAFLRMNIKSEKDMGTDPMHFICLGFDADMPITFRNFSFRPLPTLRSKNGMWSNSSMLHEVVSQCLQVMKRMYNFIIRYINVPMYFYTIVMHFAKAVGIIFLPASLDATLPLIDTLAVSHTETAYPYRIYRQGILLISPT